MKKIECASAKTVSHNSYFPNYIFLRIAVFLSQEYQKERNIAT